MFVWSDGVRDGVDALPGGDDVVGPGLDRGDLEGPAASAADEAGSGVQEAVAQGLGLGFRQVAVESQQLQPGQEDAGGRDHYQAALAIAERLAAADPANTQWQRDLSFVRQRIGNLKASSPGTRA